MEHRFPHRKIAQGYKDVKERSAIVRFKVKDEDAYILAWTTTPWTLPSNLALCVNPKEDYAKVKAADGHVYYMACALLDTVLGRLAEEAKMLTKFLRLIRELIWKEKNMSRCISVQQTRLQNSARKHSMLYVMNM